MSTQKQCAEILALQHGLDPMKVQAWAEKHGVCLKDLIQYLGPAPDRVVRVFEEALLNDLPFTYERKDRHD